MWTNPARSESLGTVYTILQELCSRLISNRVDLHRPDVLLTHAAMSCMAVAGASAFLPLVVKHGELMAVPCIVTHRLYYTRRRLPSWNKSGALEWCMQCHELMGVFCNVIHQTKGRWVAEVMHRG
jgi:hypothetical protein